MTRMLKHPQGFSLMEVTVVSGLMALLALLLSSTWVGVGRTASDLIGRSRLVQERDLAVVALGRDLGGYCSVATNHRTGEKINGRWLNWAYTNNASLPSNQDLTLSYDGGTADPETSTVVQYLLLPPSDPEPVSSWDVPTSILVRRESGADFVVARNVQSMAVKLDEDDPDDINIVLCFRYRKLTLTCDLTAKCPSVSSQSTLPWSINRYTAP